MANSKQIWFLVCVFCGFSMGSFAQDWLESDLQKAVFQALQTHREIQMGQKEMQKTGSDRERVQAKRLPQVSLLGGYAYTHAALHTEFSPLTMPITGIQLFEEGRASRLHAHWLGGGMTAQQVLFSGLQISNAEKALDEKQKAEFFMMEASKVEIAKEVILTFDQLMLLKEVDKLIEDSEIRLEKERERVHKAIGNGLAIPYDRDKIKLALLELEEKKKEVEGNREVLYAKLNYLTQMPKEELRQIDYRLTPFIANSEGLDSDNRLEIRALEAGRKAKEYVYKQERGSRLPQVFAFGSVAYINSFDAHLKLKDRPLLGDVNAKLNHLRMEPMAAVGVGMKWDVFRGGEHKKKIKKAEIDLAISELKLSDTQEKMRLLLHKSQVDLETHEKRLKITEQQIKITQNNLNLVHKQFALGLVDLTERLAVENDWFKVSLNHYNQILNQREATVNLWLASGELINKI